MNTEIQLRICKNCTKIIIGNQRTVCDDIIDENELMFCKYKKNQKGSYDF